MANEIQELKFQVGEAWKGVYSSSTAYGLANVVQDPTGLSIYRSLKSGNVGHPLSNASWWFRIIDMSSIKAESDRIAALNEAIAQDEALRVAAEELRQQHEAERVAAETQRNEAEQARISAEQARVNAESARAIAEQQRITAEESRVSAESARVQAEQARVLAETLRANAEDQRAANEQNRIAAEQQRIERAEQDHQRAESDHATYVDSLGAFDISSYHATDGVLAKYADLTAALGTNGANIPDDLRKGGMSVKFVQSSDNKYVQYRYMGTATTGTPNPFLNIYNWQNENEIINLIHETNVIQGKSDGIMNVSFRLGGLYTSDGKLISTNNNSRISSIYPIPLKQGDIISITEGYRFYLTKLVNGSWTDPYYTWKTGSFTIDADTDYSIQVSSVPESVVSDVDILASQLTITVKDNFPSEISNIKTRTKKLEDNVFYGDFVAYNGEITSIVSSDVTNDYPTIFSADTIAYTPDSSKSFTGIQLKLTKFAIGSTIKVSGSRNVTPNTWFIRIDFRDAEGQRIGEEITTKNDTLERVIPSGVALIEITLAAAWGAQLPSGTTVTFSDVQVCYSTVEDIQYLNGKVEVLEKETLYDAFSALGGAIQSVTNPNNALDLPNVKEASSIVFTTGSSNFNGVQLLLDKFAVGSTLVVSGTRSLSPNNFFIRINCLNASNQKIGGDYSTTSNILKRQIPEGTEHIEITLAANWGTELASGTQVTFSDVKIYYDTNVYSGALAPRQGSIYNVQIPAANFDYPYINVTDFVGFIVGSSNYTGLEMTLTEFSIGSTLAVSGTRSISPNNWFLRIDCFDSENQRIGGEVTTKNNILKRIIPNGTVKVVITLAANWATQLEQGSTVIFRDIKVYYSDIADLHEDVTGSGNTIYTGERIVLENEGHETHRCDVDVYADYTAENVGEGIDTDKVFYKNQSMTIYNGYMFFFSENGGGAVADYETKEIISEFDSLPIDYQHANSAQFSDIFYDSNDEFPLLFISRCGNASFQSGDHDYDEMLIYRVIRDNTNFTFTLINAVKVNARTFGVTWGIDNIRHRLYAVAPRNGNWQVQTDNYFDWWVFEEPTKQQIISGTPIVLQEADNIACFKTDFLITQGCVVHNGIMYIGVSDTTQYVYAIDLLTGRIDNRVPMIQGMEIEGVAVYDGKMYASCKTQTNLKVLEVTF